MTRDGAIAANRFGLGARPGEIDAASGDPKTWLREQLTDAAADQFPNTTLRTSMDGVSEFITITQRRREAQRSGNENPELQRELGTAVRRAVTSEVQARSMFGAMTPAPFHERLVKFWSNHFTVSTRSPQTAMVAGAYEREAIRPNILGRFEDLLLAAIGHPAMLIYLDNWQSIGPDSRAGRRAERGLNENLAREVLELHTVTPEAGYSQEDIVEFAKALTGWTVGNRRIGRDRMGEPIFAERLHQPGARRVLGVRYAQDGREQAEAVMRDLAARPETARNLALKLAKHFIDDTPPAAAVDALASTYLESDGDLTAVYDTLIARPEAWNEALRKVKSPDELLTSTARLMGLDEVFAGRPRAVFESLAQRPFDAPSPEGWPDEAGAWLGPDALMKRIEWANRLASRSPDIDARDLLETALGPMASADTMQTVARAESGEQALALALMSPDFQRR